MPDHRAPGLAAGALVLAVGLVACGSSEPAPPVPKPTLSAALDPVTGQTLESFKGDLTYPWRVRLAKHPQAYLAALARIEPGWDGPLSFARGVNICQILTLGYGETDVLSYVASQFQETEAVPPRADAKAALGVIHSSICPEVALPGQ